LLENIFELSIHKDHVIYLIIKEALIAEFESKLKTFSEIEHTFEEIDRIAKNFPLYTDYTEDVNDKSVLINKLYSEQLKLEEILTKIRYIEATIKIFYDYNHKTYPKSFFEETPPR
jgi:hypothetical protein